VDVNKLCSSGATAFNVALITGWLLKSIESSKWVSWISFPPFLPGIYLTGKVDIAETLMKQLDFNTKRVRVDLGFENIV